MKRKIKKVSLLALIISACVLGISVPETSEALSKFGSSGTEVYNIQRRLKAWGYYYGDIDGIYGSRTVAAVKKFQSANGLAPDGIAGPATLAKIGLSTGTSSYNQSGTVNLLAMAINGEARGEPYTGQVAVGAVILNRVKHSSFPNSVAGVIYQPGAFDAVSDGQINMAVSDSCIRAAQDALGGWDPAHGAIYYYNPRTATNSWIKSRPVVASIGKHVFCR
ncbi:MAG: spore cortex-lytic enzyme [Clostridia bacterium]|nr:spore cortex-lytic enzyme [Clostridia bacterium]